MSDATEEIEVGAIVSRIGLLFERAHTSASPPAAAELEGALADGYACLLALEADRARIARRSAELFGSGNAVRSAARELRSLNALLLARDLDMLRLRAVLEELRDYVAEAALA